VLKRTLLVLFALVLVLVFGVFPYWLAVVATGASTRSSDRMLTETPGTYGADFKDVEFQTSDGVKISGWLLASKGKPVTVVYSHGLFRSRRELLARALDLWRLGYGALLYDSRNHGASGKARVSLGYHERLDAQAAVRFLKQEVSTPDRIVLFGISMGAATALLAASEDTEVAAVISDSSFLSFKDTIDHHLKMFLRLPPFPLAAEIRFFIESRADFDGSKLDAAEAVRKIGYRPILFIAAQGDRRMPPEIAERLKAISASPASRILIVNGEGSEVHGHAYQTAPADYVETIDKFLRAAVGD
jgi:pimeloyl-ACP methyl ester carboxylesterase